MSVSTYAYLRLMSNQTSRAELAIREALIEEERAIIKYRELASLITDPTAIATLNSIIDEEIKHVGEFQKVLDLITKKETTLIQEGSKEVKE